MAKVALTPAQKVAAWRKRFAAADPEEQKKILVRIGARRGERKKKEFYEQFRNKQQLITWTVKSGP